ncbi:hypothetical protein LQ764DRAFT_232390 [Zygosaccharomyces rouxii]|nr:hypothetical protein LQ764DRAFT_232390 [Zygosaccharomyces rouxii]
MLPTRFELMISTLLVWRLTNLAIEATFYDSLWGRVSYTLTSVCHVLELLLLYIVLIHIDISRLKHHTIFTMVLKFLSTFSHV